MKIECAVKKKSRNEIRELVLASALMLLLIASLL